MNADPHGEVGPSRGLAVSRLRKSLGGTTVLDGVTFTAQEGRIVGLLGPNGAGKTTTMKAITGLSLFDDGRITYAGAALRDVPRGVGGVVAVFEQPGVSSLTRAGRHLKNVAAYYGKGAAEVASVAQRIGLKNDLRKRVGAYSMGMKRRLGLAEVLLAEPRWLLLDEPMNGLDPEGMMWLRGLLRTLRDAGTCVIVSSHLLNEVADLVDDVVVMKDGRVIFTGSQQEMVTAVGPWIRSTDPQDLRFVEFCRSHGLQVLESDQGYPIVGRTSFDAAHATSPDTTAAPSTMLMDISLQQAYFLLLHLEGSKS